jgi:predicted transcriptional regulator|tara:strand:- start:1263 stop:1691 length:429 start_codon:yes stop_codon:yes gene_type:complete
MEENYSWIYLLIFLIIPLARILPRILKRGGIKEKISARLESPRENFFKESYSSDNFKESPSREEFSTKNWSKEKIVLGLLMTNISKFEELQKRGNLSTNNLDRILQDFEKKGFMTSVEKSGPFGKSIQLKITEKGVGEFRRM